MNQTGRPSPTVRRRRRSDAEIAALLSAYAESGQRAREFCKERQLSVASFSSLLRRRTGLHSSPKSFPTTAPAGLGAASLVPVKIIEERALLSVTNPSSLIVEIPGGFRITVDQDFDVNTLQRLVAALGRE